MKAMQSGVLMINNYFIDAVALGGSRSCWPDRLRVHAGEHEHTIIGYSLVKGIGDGEPIASERFTVGGHEWVLLFYPDGKRSSSSEAGLGGGVGAAIGPPPGAGNGFEGDCCPMVGFAQGPLEVDPGAEISSCLIKRSVSALSLAALLALDSFLGMTA